MDLATFCTVDHVKAAISAQYTSEWQYAVARETLSFAYRPADLINAKKQQCRARVTAALARHHYEMAFPQG